MIWTVIWKLFLVWMIITLIIAAWALWLDKP